MRSKCFCEREQFSDVSGHIHEEVKHGDGSGHHARIVP